jgi:thiopurine S-methyltransferase
MTDLDEQFWNQRYIDNNIGWDTGSCSTAFIDYFSQISNKELKILIPGGGRGHEASYLFSQGFENVFTLDLSIEAIEAFQKLNPNFPVDQIIHGDFFEHQETYDLILEQTFFCALNPSLREQYVEQMSERLNSKGKLVGLLFDFTFEAGPPFSGNKKEYLELFSKTFNINTIESCYNSIKPRLGKELFVIFEKK